MIGMLVLLLAALLVLPSCFDDDTETVEGPDGYDMPTARKLPDAEAGDECVAD